MELAGRSPAMPSRTSFRMDRHGLVLGERLEVTNPSRGLLEQGRSLTLGHIMVYAVAAFVQSGRA
jgi:hypothetical protein